MTVPSDATRCRPCIGSFAFFTASSTVLATTCLPGSSRDLASCFFGGFVESTDSISLSGSVTVRRYLLSVVSSTSPTAIAALNEPLAEGQAAYATTPLAARDRAMKRSRLGCPVFRALRYVRRKNSQCRHGGRTLMRLALPSFAKPLVAKRTFSLCFWPRPAASGRLRLPLAARLPGADPGAVYVTAVAAAADERLRSAPGAQEKPRAHCSVVPGSAECRWTGRLVCL